eukprot:gene9768-13139_t
MGNLSGSTPSNSKSYSSTPSKSKSSDTKSNSKSYTTSSNPIATTNGLKSNTSKYSESSGTTTESIQISKSISIGGRTTSAPANITKINNQLTWIDVIVDKLRKSGNEYYKNATENELRNTAFILGDPTAFYNHFFKTLPDQNAARQQDISEIVSLLANHTQLNDLELNAAMERQQLAIKAVADGDGELEISLTFREIGFSWTMRQAAKALSYFGGIHAAIVVNNAMIIEWGCGPGGDHLIIPRNLDVAEIGASFIIAKHSSGFYNQVTQYIYNPLEAIMDLLRYLGSVIGLFQATSKELKKISENICEWNRTKYYDPLNSNCQHFANSICIAATGKRFTPGREISNYMDRVSSGDRTLVVGDTVFDTAQQLHDFVCSDMHHNFSNEQKFMLAMFYKLFLIRHLNDPTNTNWKIYNPNAFAWGRFTAEVSKGVGVYTETY